MDEPSEELGAESSRSARDEAHQTAQTIRLSATRSWQFTSTFDRHFWLALLFAAAIVIPRSALIIRAHSDYYDDQYHLVRGMRFIADKLTKKPIELNDPPLGEALTALPVWWSGVRSISGDIIYGQTDVNPETLRLRIGIWKSVLFLPMVAVAFVWLRRVYGLRSAWMGTVALIFEPTLAAHIPTGGVDVLGVEGIVIGCFFAWLFFEGPTIVRCLAAGVSIAIALLLKHTAAIFPIVILLMAMLHALRDSSRIRAIPRRLGQAALVGVIASLALWMLVRRDVSQPAYPPKFKDAHASVDRVLQMRWPAGVYVGSLVTAVVHADRGAPGYLFGAKSQKGWWYYFPAVGTYKIPIGLGVLMMLGIGSLFIVKPKWAEWSLALPMIAWALFLMSSGINIGWRHFLAPYVLLIMFACRVGAIDRRAWQVASWGCIALASIHAALWHPNYLSYFNFPRYKPYLSVSDSNVDWGQSLKQAARWIDEHPRTDKPVYVLPFARAESGAITFYLNDRAKVLTLEDPVPRHGILIISSVWESGANDGKRRYRFLQRAKPIASIGGGAMQVYDLDQIRVASSTIPATAPQK